MDENGNYIGASIDELSNHTGDGVFRKYTMQSNIELAMSDPIPLPDVIGKLRRSKGTIASKALTMCQEIIDINATLSATGSTRFYSGEEAQKGVTNRESIQTTIGDLTSAMDGLDIDEVGKTIAKYNADLKVLKKKTRLRRLQEIADSLKGRVVEEDNYNKTYTSSQFPPSTYRQGNYWLNYNCTFLNSETETIQTSTGQTQGEAKRTYNIDYKKTIDIDYDGWIESNADTVSFLNICKWADDDFEELKGKILSVKNDYPNKMPGDLESQINNAENMGNDVPDAWCTYSSYASY